MLPCFVPQMHAFSHQRCLRTRQTSVLKVFKEAVWKHHRVQAVERGRCYSGATRFSQFFVQDGQGRARRAALSLQNVVEISKEYALTFPMSAAERNKSLTQNLRAAAADDPFAYDIIKQDGREFMTGAIDAREFRDRFLAIYGNHPNVELLFLDMVMLVPALPRRQQLLNLVPNPWAFRRPVQTSATSSPGQAATAAGSTTKAVAEESEEDEHGDEDDEDEEGEHDDTADDEDDGWDEEEEEETVEDVGWEVMDRSRMAALVAELMAEDKEATASHPQQSSPTPSAQTLPSGAEHFNSASSLPAKPLPSRKSKRMGASAGLAPSTASSTGAGNVVLWLRQDLRLHDNPALVEAARLAKLHGGTVTVLYVHSPEEDGGDLAQGGRWRPGQASLLWLQHALQSLQQSLTASYGPGASIVFRQGPYLEAVADVATAVGATTICCNRRYEPAMAASDRIVEERLVTAGFRLMAFNALLLREPWEVTLEVTSSGGHFGSLMPFYRAWAKLGHVPAPLKAPKRMPAAEASPAAACGGLALADLGLYKAVHRAGGQVVDWGSGIRSAWDMTETAALQLLDEFISQKLSLYESQRGYADGRAVAHLSPYLHWGQLSPRLMWHKLEKARVHVVSKTFYRRLVWRELAYWQLHHWPDMCTEPIRSHYEAMEWAQRPDVLKAWQQGCTGYPLVDAGMRELWQTGWMQQNVRMAAACFLTEYAGLPWVEGARWFHDTLVDADQAINSMMWQSAGKTGLDQWSFTVSPCNRTMDPQGTYIKRWVPELRGLGPDHIHMPWLAPAEALEAAGVQLGVSYPHRVITEDLASLRLHNTAAIRAVRRLHKEEFSDPQGYDLVVAPKGSTVKHDGMKVRVTTRPEYRRLESTRHDTQLAGVGETPDEVDEPALYPIDPTPARKRRIASGNTSGQGNTKTSRKSKLPDWQRSKRDFVGSLA